MPAGRGHQDVADLLGRIAELFIETDNQVELLFLLDHLSGHVAAHRGLDQAVDVGHVQAVAGDLGAIDGDGQTRLAKLVHQGDFLDAAHALKD